MRHDATSTNRQNTRNLAAGRPPLGAIVPLAALASSCLPAHAEVVTFDNSAGVFQWKLSVRLADGTTASEGTYLDITQPPTQSGAWKQGSFGQWFRWNSTSSEAALRFIESATKSQQFEQIATETKTIQWNNKTIFAIAPRQYQPGQSTSTTDTWETQGFFFYHLPFTSDLSKGTPAIETLAYLGVRIKAGTNKYNYGWILFKDYTTPIAWAYETIPNKMIEIPVPAPSAFAIAAVFAIGATTRRPQRSRGSLRVTSHAVPACVSVAMLATQAHAEVVTFDNSAGVFQWKLSVRLADGSTASEGNYLDITQPPTQSGAWKERSLGQWFRWNSTSSEAATRFIESATKSQQFEQIATETKTIKWNNKTIFAIAPRQYLPGQSTSTADEWDWQGAYFYHLPFTSDLSKGTPAIEPLAYLGVRIKAGTNKYNYGWILFKDYTTPLAWAYETIPNKMIEIPVPAPSASSLLLVGLAAATRRRRR